MIEDKKEKQEGIKVTGLRSSAWVPNTYHPTTDVKCLIMESKSNNILGFLYMWGTGGWIRVGVGHVYTLKPSEIACFLPVEDCEIVLN